MNSEQTSVAKLQGIQFTGKFIESNEELEKRMYSLYYKKFPFARAKPAPVWGLELATIKMTDNTLGFGTKLHWSRAQELEP